MSSFETSENFASALAAALPEGAFPFRTEGAEGYAWQSRLAARMTMDMPVFVGLTRDGAPRAGVAHWLSGASAEPHPQHVHLLPILKDLGLAGPGSDGRPGGDAGATDFARRFASAIDLEAVRILVQSNATDVEAYAWLADRGPERPRRHALASAYPWAVDALLEGGVEIWDDTEEEVACDILRSGDMSGCGPEGTLRHVVRSVRGMGFEGFDRRDLPSGLRALTFMPKAWIPQGREDLAALTALAPHLLAYAATTGRPVSESMRPGDGWAASLSRLAAKAGTPRSTPRDAAAGVARLVRDMSESFHRQVAWPAAVQVEGALRDWPPRAPILGSEARAQRSGLSVVSHRILFGGRAFPAAVEAAVRWNAGSTRIANVVAGLAAAEEISWAAAFPPTRDRLGVVVACISDATEMLSEANELGHCVCTYLPRCLAGESVIASVRSVDRDGGVRERLSTVELRWGADGTLQPVQHHGPGNGPPPDVAVIAVRRFATALCSGEIETFRGGSPDEANAALLSLYRDRFDVLSEAWAPHLNPVLRGSGPLSLLESGGVGAEALREAVERAAAPGIPRSGR